jgi:hypothetical protein
LEEELYKAQGKKSNGRHLQHVLCLSERKQPTAPPGSKIQNSANNNNAQLPLLVD